MKLRGGFLLFASLAATAPPARAQDGGFEAVVGRSLSDVAAAASGIFPAPSARPAPNGSTSTSGSAPEGGGADEIKSPRVFRTLEETFADDAELAVCPDAQALADAPDPDLYTYIGFRYVRDDGSTCAARPGAGIFYEDALTQDYAYKADPSGDLSAFDYSLSGPEYKLRRNFYLRTQLDGSRKFFSFDAKQYTGKQIPETARLTFANRADKPLLPWLSPESFRLTYGLAAGARLAAVQTLYQYDIRSGLGRDAQGRRVTTFQLTAGNLHQLSPPDPKAVGLTLAPSADGRSLVAAVTDAWAKYYKGEKLGLQLKVSRKSILGDKTTFDIDVALDDAAELAIDLADARWAPYKKEDLKRGHEYYADWSFSRANSKISTGERIAETRTAVVRLQAGR